MIPLSGVVHPQDVGAKRCLLALTDGHGHGDSGTHTFRLVDEDGAPMVGGGGADEHHAEADAVPAVLQSGLAEIPGEDAAADALGNAGAAVRHAQAEHPAAAGQLGRDSPALRGEFDGVGQDVQNRPFQLFPVGKTVDWLVRPLVGQGDAGVGDKGLRLFKEFGEQRRNVHRFLVGDGGAALGVGHIADDPENLEQPPVQTGDLLCRPGTFFRGAEGEQAVGGDHHVGQRLPQLPGGQRHGAKLAVVRFLFQQEYINVVHPCDRRAAAVGGQVQRQIQTPAGERGVLLRACQKQRADIRAGGDEKAPGGLIDLDDLIFFYAEAGADHQIQHSQRIFLFFHDDPPSSPIMRRMGENFPGKIRRFFHFSF